MLNELLSRLHEEEKSGYVNKETLLQIADFIANHTYRELNQEPSSPQAYDILHKYRFDKLLVASKYVAPIYVDRERKKTYQKRCAYCGLAITNKILSDHTCRTAKKPS